MKSVWVISWVALDESGGGSYYAKSEATKDLLQYACKKNVHFDIVEMIKKSNDEIDYDLYHLIKFCTDILNHVNDPAKEKEIIIKFVEQLKKDIKSPKKLLSHFDIKMLLEQHEWGDDYGKVSVMKLTDIIV